MHDLAEILLGTLLGILTGLVPGLHANLLIPLLPGSLMILGIYISHTFFDFIPSLVLGVPDEASSVASLPGHRLVLEGKGKLAFRLSVIGGLLASVSLILSIPVALFLSQARWAIPGLLLASLVLLVFSTKRKLETLVIMALAISLSFISPKGPSFLVAFFTGLFGIPTLVHSLVSDARVPKQRDLVPRVNLKVPLISAFAGIMAGLLPGITSSIASIISSEFFRLDDEKKVMLVGGINTVYAISSFLAIWLIGRPRSGVAIHLAHLGIKLIPAMFLAVSFSAVLAWFLGPRLFDLMASISGRPLNLGVLVFLVCLIFIINPRGIPMLFASASLGILAYSLKVRRSAGLAFIIFPVALNYLV